MKHYVRFVLITPLIVQLFAHPSADPVASMANKTEGSLKSPNATDAMSALTNNTKALHVTDMEKQGTQIFAAIFIAMQKFMKEVMTALSPISIAAPGMDVLSKMPELLNPADIEKNMMDEMKKLLASNGTKTSTKTPSLLNPLDIGKNMMDGMMKILGGSHASSDDSKDSKPANATEPAATNTSTPTPPKDMAKAVEDVGKNMLAGITGLLSG